jgi:hypothetical protein
MMTASDKTTGPFLCGPKHSLLVIFVSSIRVSSRLRTTGPSLRALIFASVLFCTNDALSRCLSRARLPILAVNASFRDGRRSSTPLVLL